MEDTPAFSWRQSQESVHIQENRRKAKQKSRATKKQTAGAVGRLFVENCDVSTRKQLYTARFIYVTTSRKATFHSRRGPVNGRYSTTISVLLGSMFFVCLYPSLGVYPQAVSSGNVAPHNSSATEEYLRGSGTPRMVGAKVRSTHMCVSCSPTRLEEKSTLNTARHEGGAQAKSGESRNSVLGRRSTHEVTKKKRNSVSAQHSIPAPYYEAEDHSAASSLQSSASAEDRQIVSALTPGGSDTALLHDHTARTTKTRGETISHSFLENVHKAKQEMHKHSHAAAVRSRQTPSASAPASSSSAETRQAFDGEESQEYNSASRLSAKPGRSEGAVHETEMPLQRLPHDEELNNSSNADIAYRQLLPLSGTVSAAADASLIQTGGLHTEKLLPTAVTAAVDGSVVLRANVGGEVYHGPDPSGAEAAARTASTPAPELSPVSLVPTAQLLQATPAGQQQILPVQEAGQTAYGAATPTQTSIAQLPGLPSLPVSPQQLLTTAPESVQGAGTSSPQTPGPEMPPPLHQQTAPITSAFSPAGVQNTSTANTSGVPGISSVAGAFENAPSNVQPPTVVAAVVPTALPPLAGAPPPAVSAARGLSPGEAPTPVITTAASPTTATPTGEAVAITTSPFPPQTPLVPSVTVPASAVPAPTAAMLPEPTVATSPLSVPTSASAEITGAAALGSAPAQVAPAQVAPAQAAAGNAAVGAPLTGGNYVVPPMGSEGKTRTRPSGGSWGALLPPTALSGGKEPTKPERVVVNQGVRASGETVKLQTSSQPTCLEACNCVALILGGFVCLFFCLMSVIIATLLMSRLFSKGLFSMAFFRGGANAIFAAAALGLTIGGLTGGLVHRCWPGALYFGGGLMSFFAALVLLGKRGAGVGALGGVITGGSIGGLASTEALPISLGCIVGLLLGIVLGFAPIFRDLKMNTRYIRYGFESRQPSLQPGDTVGRMSRTDGLPTKRLSQRLLSSPSKTSSLRTSVSVPSAQGGIGRRAESLPSSS